MCQSWRYVQCALFWKNQHNVKTVNVVTQIFDRFVGQVCLEILRCCSESISMKVSDIIIQLLYEDDVMRFLKNSFESFRDIQKILNEVAFVQVVRKRANFQDSQERKYTNFISQHQNMILSSILTLLKNNLTHL